MATDDGVDGTIMGRLNGLACDFYGERIAKPAKR
jgi:hypothetical protein